MDLSSFSRTLGVADDSKGGRLLVNVRPGDIHGQLGGREGEVEARVRGFV